MISSQIGYLAGSLRGTPFLHYIVVDLLPLWALFKGNLAADVVVREIVLLLTLSSGH